MKPHIAINDGLLSTEHSCFDGLPDGFVRQGNNGELHIGLKDATCLITAPVVLAIGATDKPISLNITLGASSRLTVVEQHNGTAKIDKKIVLNHQAKLVHSEIIAGNDNTSAVFTADTSLAQGAYHDYTLLTSGMRSLDYHMTTTLQDAMAQASLQGLILLRDRKHAKLTFDVRHQAGHANSRQNVRAVLSDKAQCDFRGRISVLRDAQKTEARQLCRALVLSDQALMHAVPELAIEADDVVCSHGCAVGDLDAAALFLLRSRGIPEALARSILIESFMNDVVEGLAAEARTVIGDKLNEWLVQ